MELYITCQDESVAQKAIRVEKKLGRGKFSVYLVYSETDRKHYALKTFPMTPYGIQQYQKELVASSLHHPNIIEYVSLTYVSKEYYGFITEIAKYGDLMKLIEKRGPLDNETLLRTYFHQLIDGLEYIHSQGLAHLDLKLENLVLGKDFGLKIIDFDQAQLISDNYIVSAGTSNYRAPEIIIENCQNLSAADIYSAGIILFALKTGQYPFMEKLKPEGICLYLYSRFTRDNEKFWKDKAESLKEETSFSQDFIELINGMLEYNVDKRFSIQQIKDSKWYKGQAYCKESLKAEMKAFWTNRMKKLVKPVQI